MSVDLALEFKLSASSFEKQEKCAGFCYLCVQGPHEVTFGPAMVATPHFLGGGEAVDDKPGTADEKKIDLEVSSA